MAPLSSKTSIFHPSPWGLSFSSHKPGEMKDRSSSNRSLVKLPLVNSQQTSLVPHLHCSSPSWAHPKISPLQPLGIDQNSQALPNAESPLLISNCCSKPSSSSSSSLPTTMANERSVANSNRSDPILHPAMGDEEMAEIRSISEKHDMEWNDAVNFVTLAWWSKLLKAVEADGSENREGDGFEAFIEEMDQRWTAMEVVAFPWLDI